MAEAKEGKVDVEYFKNMVQNSKVTELQYGPSGMDQYEVQVDYLCGWILDFFAYYGESRRNGKIIPFNEKKIKVKNFEKLAPQMLIVPFTVKDLVHNKTYLMKYKVGFAGCEQNEKKEVIPVQGWLVSPSTEKERNSIL